jgi:hypothetical protein
MKYIKVPYVRLKGKKYGGDFTSEENESVSNFYASSIGEGVSQAYGGTFQELYKTYKNGEDPLDMYSIPAGKITNPEKIVAIHNAITAIAKKYGYNPPNESELAGAVTSEVFQKISVPNSYFVTSQDDVEHILVITDNDSKIIYLGLPADEDFKYFVSVDKNRNMLIPKEAYDENLDLF